MAASELNYRLFGSPRKSSEYENSLKKLVSSFPLLGAPAVTTACQKTLASALAANLPNDKIAPQPPASYAYSGSITYKYTGNYNGYRSAFYPSGITDAAQSAVTLMDKVDFGKYSVPNVTSEIAANVSVTVDSTKVAQDISDFKSAVSKQCTQLYIPVFQFAYDPTASAVNDIPQGSRVEAANELDSCIKDGQFTANINIALAGDTDSANAATWFLYNLWTALTVLGFPDVNSAIKEYKDAGLNIPSEVYADQWDQGSYVTWLTPSTGSYLYSSTFKSTMPEEGSTHSGGVTRDNPDPLKNGYSLSFCEYGSLALYIPHSSCFAAGTNVLMADLSVKDISSIQKDDYVTTTQGPRKVIMVESPPLDQRNLWNINGFDLHCTEGHCFRAADNEPVKRWAVDELVTMDSAPTMSMNGGSVGKCKPECLIQAKLFGGDDVVDHVQNVDQEPKPDPDDDARVYDIILENWWADDPAYFVGGPQIFLAADAETSNPKSDQPTSAAILAAMEVALSACDNPDASPFVLMSLSCATLDLISIERRAREMAWHVLAAEPPKAVRIPKTDTFENEDGKWSELASYMEYFLISNYARWIRSIIRVNADPAVDDALPNDVIAIGIHDIELSGDHSMPSNSTVSVEITLSNGQKQQSQKMDIAQTESKTSCFIQVHKRSILLDADNHSRSHLSGELLCDGLNFAHFERSIVLENIHGRFFDAFLYDSEYKVIGRMGISVRRVREWYGEWEPEDESMMFAKGVAVGRQLGYQLGAALEQNGSRINFKKWVK